MAIGDDMFALLGLVPVRDRAGIARGTMANEAHAALAAEAPRPPSFALPENMLTGAPPPDVTLPDDVPASYAAGKSTSSPIVVPHGKGPAPGVISPLVPQERVIASSPAAAPSGEVVRNSDIILQAIRKQEEAARMQRLFSSIGLIANGLFNRNAESAHATRQGLAGGLSAGGGMDTASLQKLLEMRDAETAKENAIQHGMRTQGLSRADATTLQEQGQLASRNAPSELREAEKIREDARILRSIEPHMAAYAAAIGMDETAARAVAKKDPQKFLELVNPGAMATVQKQQLENTKATSEQTAREANILRLVRSGASPQEIIDAYDPEAYKEGAKKRTELGVTTGPAAAKEAYNEFIKKDHELAKANENYLKGSAQQIGNLWHPGLVTGTFADFRQSVLHRPVMTFLEKFGVKSEDVNSTAQLKSILAKITTENAKLIPGPASNKDIILAGSVSGSDTMTPQEIRAITGMIENANRQGIVTHNERADAMGATSPEMKREFNQVRRIAMPEPSKILRDDVYTPGNEKLRSDMTLAKRQLDTAKDTPDEPAAQQAYDNMRKIFDRELGAGLSDWFVRQPPKGGKK